MIKSILLLLALVAARPQSSIVYICDSPKAYAYHNNQNCSGLQRCTHGVSKVSEKDAIAVYGRVKCHICYK